MSDVTVSGPFFDSAVYDEAMCRFQRDATMDIADEGVRDIRVGLSQVLRHPTGRYEASIRAREQAFDTAIVDGESLIYAWWLEGVGSRNSPVTRFPGYFTFRRTTPELQAKAVEVAEKALQRFIEEVNA